MANGCGLPPRPLPHVGTGVPEHAWPKIWESVTMLPNAPGCVEVSATNNTRWMLKNKVSAGANGVMNGFGMSKMVQLIVMW